MPDFNAARSALNSSRDRWLEAQDALAVAQEETARLEARHAEARRTKSPRGNLRELEAQLAEARADEAAKRDLAARLQSTAAERARGFAEFVDPRTSIAEWTDNTPILLLPVRLETRFKSIPAGAGSRDELWVRIYPDECSVDSFEAMLSETEVESGKRFWIETWAAGGVAAQRRAAWRNLAASHGTGRGAWIVREFAPTAAPIAKAKPEDIILVIAADTLPNAAAQAALGEYWEAIWRADGAKTPIDAARQALEAKLNLGDPAQLIARFAPANLAVAPAPLTARATAKVSVAWLRLPAPGTVKTRSWTAPARVHMLPDQFLVLGYQGGQQVFEAQGAVIPAPLVVGPDPSAPDDQQFKHDANGELVVPAEMRWMVDFDAAVHVGMGIKVPLDPARVDLIQPIDRLFAVGVRLADDVEQGRARLEELLTHHRYGRSGFAFLPQGTPTNNTEAEGAGYSRIDNADEAYDTLFGDEAQLTPVADWWQRRDGQWLADGLGIDSQVFDRVPHASGTDLAEGRALNRALWPSTLGYAMETMLLPVFDAEQVDATRWFYTHFVSGRGMLPSLRIGDQPYGVLPISAMSRWNWLGQDRIASVAGLTLPPGFLAYRQGLADLLMKIREDWTPLAWGVSAVGKRGDPHQVLLDVIGLHPASVEFHQRYAESLEHIFNRAKLQGLGGDVYEQSRVQVRQAEAMALLRRLGYTGENEPDALSKFFFSRSNRLNGPIVDDRPLSERQAVRSYTDDNRNYIAWLVDTARGSFEDLRQERGFTDNRAPDALLYVLLRHALLLGYWDTSLRLYTAADMLTPDEAALARREPAFIHVTAGDDASESRYAPLYSSNRRVSGRDNLTVADHISAIIGQPGTEAFADQLSALELLKNVPTARLERCLSEHIDTANARLDAWLLGLVHYQLAAMRSRASRGVYLGAYGWLENLQRKTATLQEIIPNGELASMFGGAARPPLMRDPDSGGYVFAPSINQATTAAILRAGYLANATPANPGALAVNLSSARVRVALSLIEGIRNGQPLGALLGYRFQRGLHEGYGTLELDRFLYPLRKQFPLVADQMSSTKTPEGVSIEAIEANHVLDGLKLIDHVRTTGDRAYPFGVTLPAANPDERAAIDAEVGNLLDAHDALADLALAEGVHQAVLGNFDRVAATFDAYAKGTFPPEPEVILTPRSGIGLTHRVGIQFEAGIDFNVSPITGVQVSPRARAQAMVNRWLLNVLPDPYEVGCLVEWFDPVANTLKSETVTQASLKLQPIDLLYLVSLDGDAALGELDDRILKFLIAKHAPRADAPISIRHTSRLPPPLKSFFEVASLVRHLRRLLLGSRPLMPTDISLIGEADRKQDATQTIARDRVQRVRTELGTLQQDLDNAVIAAPVDDAIKEVIALFERAATFGIQQVGWGFMFEWRRRAFSDILERVRAVVERWNDRASSCVVALAQYDAQTNGMSEAERYLALGRIDLLLSSTPMSPRPTTATYRANLPGRLTTFNAKLAKLQALLDTTDPRLSQLIAATQAVLPLTAFDNTAFSIGDELDGVAVFIIDLQSRLKALKKEVARRVKAADDQLQAHDAAADPAARVRALQQAGSALLGDDVTLIPEFSVDPQHSAELANAIAAGTTGTLTQFLRTATGSEFPADDWLHGIARVREKLHAWEQASALAATLGRAEPGLVPIQLPYRPGEGWLAMDFDPAMPVEGEHLLYTAHYAVAPNAGAPTCGLLLDEWTEVIPRPDETAGLTFHYDRPGSEPPQTWLLVTPAQTQGQWQWDDLVGALHETLDLARLRAVEPAQVDMQTYARFLPATTSAVTLYGISIAANLSRVNKEHARLRSDRDG